MEISGVGQGHKRFPLLNERTVKNLQLPRQTLRISELHVRQRHLKRLPIEGYTGVTPDLLIGLDNVHLGIAKRIAEDGHRGPAAVLTKLGWVIYGPMGYENVARQQVLLVREHAADKTLEDETIDELVKNFIISDDLSASPTVKHVEPQEEVRARAILENTTVRIGDRFETGLLWRTDEDIPEYTRGMAERRLLALERRFKCNAELKHEYIKTMRHYLAKGYSRKLTKEETLTKHPRIWYLPHFGVYNLNKPGKVRLVFDAAAQVSGRSLNSYLLSGPDMGKPMLEVLMKFRQKPIAVSSDIEEMFHQVVVRAEDQPAQRFLWREKPDEEIVEYSMRLMTFGATCSPCAAQFVKNKNALEFSEEFPDAVNAILNNHYVDDFVHSFADEEEAVRIANQVRCIHQKGGFNLKGFISNSRMVHDALNGGHDFGVQKGFDKSNAGYPKVLGMRWDTEYDELKFVLAFGRVDEDLLQGKRAPTKRELLRVTMSVFDPFGFAAEYVLKAKLLLQTVWRARTDWDDEIPVEAQKLWRTWLNILHHVDNIKVPRCYGTFFTTGVVELHVFADASEMAFAAVAYWRISNGRDVNVAMVAGKTECAPLKLTTIPRLELQAAVLASRLRKMLLSSHDTKPSRVVMWTDSKTVQAWIASDHRRYKPYVAHRVDEILDVTNQLEWRWTPGALNPADFGTRLQSSSRECSCLCGPDFLRKDESFWPRLDAVDGTREELRAKYEVFLVSLDEDILQKYSSFPRLTRIVPYLRRFVYNSSNTPEKRLYGSLTVRELRDAELLVIRIAQRSAYADECAILRGGKQLNASSKLFRLSPMIDDVGIIRVNGRLQNAYAIPQHTRQPVVLPQRHHVTNLIIDLYHRIWKHQNQNTIIAELRRKYWIPHIREEVRKAGRRCLSCQRERARL
ncbi:PREDICTED: uncharacterized protein LOC108372923 [Rhagoletis zephyria]|uniref:uncharacterized protein LOC108372923 n=1 Tax=Rhagoletis zephyria TaxID=28612 RepID=UPI00081195D5|nr:PREDICTED: uncharacterized protein LOC108372923 [Rhagoletis zephyria]